LCSCAVEEEHIPVFKAAMTFCLDTQYVEDGEQIWKVKRGAGMGKLFARDMSNFAFHRLVEVDFLCKDEVRSRYGITSYQRYEDDILIILDADAVLLKELVNEMRARSQFYKLTVDVLSTHSCSMLDLSISKGAQWQQSGVIDIHPYTKQTSQHVYLSSKSYHPPTLHRSWPLARKIHFDRISTSKVHARKAYERLKQGILACDSSHPISDPIAPKRAQESSCVYSTWLAIPYNLVWKCKIFRDAVAEANSKLCAHGFDHHTVKIGWSLGGTHFCQKVASTLSRRLQASLRG
jgi:hypothetical protein